MYIYYIYIYVCMYEVKTGASQAKRHPNSDETSQRRTVPRVSS